MRPFHYRLSHNWTKRASRSEGHRFSSRTALLQESIEPRSRFRPGLLEDPVKPLESTGAPREHRELAVKTLQVEAANNALMSLLHEERACSRLELLLHQPKLTLGKSEALGVLLFRGVGIREEDLGRGLLDDRAADAALEDIARALGRKTHNAI